MRILLKYLGEFRGYFAVEVMCRDEQAKGVSLLPASAHQDQASQHQRQVRFSEPHPGLIRS
jgi:hypothetical protein